jgi:hypothetical protein
MTKNDVMKQRSVEMKDKKTTKQTDGFKIRHGKVKRY